MREARRGRRDKAGSHIAQLPWEDVRNPYAPMRMLSEDQMQDLHDTSIRILKELGIKVMGANVRALFAKAGARIDGEGVVDGGETKILLQIFSKTVIGPIFFEFIQRKGDDGFGEGNFQALFESIEQDQIERGVLKAS